MFSFRFFVVLDIFVFVSCHPDGYLDGQELDQLANLHSDTLRDLAPLSCGMERSNGIPMEIFRLGKN